MGVLSVPSPADQEVWGSVVSSLRGPRQSHGRKRILACFELATMRKSPLFHNVQRRPIFNDICQQTRYISNDKEANHSCGPNNIIKPKCMNPHASICLISSIGLLCHMKNEPSYRGVWWQTALRFQYNPEFLSSDISNKMLSFRRETALKGALQYTQKVEDWKWETIFYGHRAIFNHCDIIGLKICRIQ